MNSKKLKYDENTVLELKQMLGEIFFHITRYS